MRRFTQIKSRRSIPINEKSLGFWKIIEFLGHDNKLGRAYYLCECICGKVKDVGTNKGKLTSKSCGCRSHQKEEIKPFSSLFHRYINDAKARNVKFNLSYEQFEDLASSPCYYCGKVRTGRQKYNNRMTILYTGIDRVDNDKGYQSDNCVPCCKSCNTKKKAITKDMVKKVYGFLFGNK